MLASTGPQSEDRGDSGDQVENLHVREASTGPQSEDRGDVPGSVAVGTPVEWLQRGRSPKTAEMRQSDRVASHCGGFNGAAVRRPRRCPNPWGNAPENVRLQRGRSPKTAEIPHPRLLIEIGRMLQRGRSPKTAEIQTHRTIHALYRTASTGPQSEDRGDASRSSLIIASIVLQRGRSPKTAEMRSQRCTRSSRTGFNGAAVRRPRRSPGARSNPETVLASTGPQSEDRGDRTVRDGAPRIRGGFNGAAVRRPRRFRCLHARRKLLALASTGPQSEDRGDAGGWIVLTPIRRASTGPQSEDRGDPPALGWLLR